MGSSVVRVEKKDRLASYSVNKSTNTDVDA